MTQQAKTLAAKPNLSLMHGTHLVEEENQLLKIIL